MKNNFTKKNMRFYEYGLKVGLLSSGLRRTIADVPGVTVGHVTKIKGTSIRTGVTLIDPGVSDLFKNKIPAGFFVGNGYGKVAGSTQIEELGVLETPIVLTRTSGVGAAMRGIIDLTVQNTKNMQPFEAVNAVVGETNDWILNTVNADTIHPADIISAYKNRTANVAVGNVGAGTGTRAFSWKGGIGSASRLCHVEKVQYTVGVLVQTNYGGNLSILGVPIGELLDKNDFSDFLDKKPDGSCMIIVATDAPFTSRQLRRIAQRSILGIARTGGIMAQSSGDYSIAFSTSRVGVEGSNVSGKCLPDAVLNQFFLATIEATEESIYDAMFAAKTLKGRDGNTLSELPKHDAIRLIRQVYEKRKR